MQEFNLTPGNIKQLLDEVFRDIQNYQGLRIIKDCLQDLYLLDYLKKHFRIADFAKQDAAP